MSAQDEVLNPAPLAEGERREFGIGDGALMEMKESKDRLAGSSRHDKTKHTLKEAHNMLNHAVDAAPLPGRDTAKLLHDERHEFGAFDRHAPVKSRRVRDKMRGLPRKGGAHVTSAHPDWGAPTDQLSRTTEKAVSDALRIADFAIGDPHIKKLEPKPSAHVTTVPAPRQRRQFGGGGGDAKAKEPGLVRSADEWPTPSEVSVREGVGEQVASNNIAEAGLTGTKYDQGDLTEADMNKNQILGPKPGTPAEKILGYSGSAPAAVQPKVNTA